MTLKLSFNRIIIIIILICIFYTFYYLTTKQSKTFPQTLQFNNNIELFQNKNIFKETIARRAYTASPIKLLSHQKPLFILWTGGYDSTFRVCQALIDEQKYVIPIYISDIIDNERDKKTRRHNTQFEYQAMQKIRNVLNHKFPYTKKTFQPLIDIDHLQIDPIIQKHMKILKSQKRVRRSICQYGGIAQVSKNINKILNQNIFLEISVEKEPGSMMWKTIHNKVNCFNNKCYLKQNLSSYDQSLNIFKYLKFPTLHLSKKDMLNIATQNGYHDILELTWSCWYPKNGKPCNRCIMCRERIL